MIGFGVLVHSVRRSPYRSATGVALKRQRRRRSSEAGLSDLVREPPGPAMGEASEARYARAPDGKTAERYAG